jgi:hypothetical protein
MVSALLIINSSSRLNWLTRPQSLGDFELLHRSITLTTPNLTFNRV